MKTMGFEKLASLTLAFAITSGGCGDAHDLDDLPHGDVGENHGAILNGTPTGDIASVKVNQASGYGSGTMLRAEWVLTSRVAATNEGVATGGTPAAPSAISITTVQGLTKAVAEVDLFPGALNIALLRLASPVLDSTGMSVGVPLFPGPATELLGKVLTCEGWGRNTPSGGGGANRAANLTVTAASPGQFDVSRNAAGQMQALGDTGGACFLLVDNSLRITGVTSTWPNSTATTLVASEAFRDWAWGLVGTSLTAFQNASFTGIAQTLLPGGPAIGGITGRYDYRQLTVGNDTISSLLVPKGWTVIVYQNGGFDGLLQFYTASTTLLAPGINDQISSIEIAGGVVFYGQPNLQGLLARTDTAGPLAFGSMFAGGVSSLVVPSGWRVRLVRTLGTSREVQDFQAGVYTNLGTWNDRATSAEIEAPVVAYVNANFEAASQLFEVGCHDVSALALGNDAISSIHVPAGRSVRAYQNGGFQGVMKTYTGSVASMPDFNDMISSLCVDRVAF
jgi:hypothetical protein